MDQPFLSAVIITFNESKNITRCLRSLQGVVDEMVVVDSGSSDGTAELALKLGARVIHHAFAGHIEQKNFAAEQANGAWLLSLDADESLSDELMDSLKRWRASSASFNAYRVNRLTSYAGHWVRHGGWYPDEKLRLWKKGCAQWGGENPHDRLELPPGERSGWLAGDLLHHSYHSISDHLRQIRYFSDIAAEHYAGASWQTWSVVRPLKIVFQWFKNLVIKRGWRDGKTGWIIARLSAKATGEKYRKARHYRRMGGLLHKNSRQKIQRVLLCRTDAIGDVVLTLPVAGWLKSVNPELEVHMLVRSYAAPVAQAAKHVDQVLIWDRDHLPNLSDFDAAILGFPDADVAKVLKKSGVPIRVGTGRRWPFRRWVNVRNHSSRKSSGHHESWHGLELAFSLHPAPGFNRWGEQVSSNRRDWANWGSLVPDDWASAVRKAPERASWILPDAKCVILHPGSRGSANNWPLEHYFKLREKLLDAGFRVIWTGSEAEGQQVRSERAWNPANQEVDTMGQLNLSELMSLMTQCNGMVASSTGPLHLAARLGVPCVGLYDSKPPFWPERWAPIGDHVKCLSGSASQMSSLDILVEDVFEALTSPYA